ncbi:MAG TPA: response regulator [Vicinamibacterales bacterium]|nr:response regulator [Vicinamibacterales bacterium]
MTKYLLLLVEDDAAYSSYLKDELNSRCDAFRITHVDRLSDAIARVNDGCVDVVLLDLSLPDSQGLDTFHRLQAAAPHVPIVILSATLDHVLAAKAVSEGAQDYLVKSEIHPYVIERVVRYAINRRAAETERQEFERRFLRAQRMESLGTLAGGIAHDLNNILAPVLMSIELLKEETDEAERAAILDTIEASARRGAAMVRQVLTFARGVDGERTAVDVPALLEGVRQFANDTFMKSIAVSTTTEPDVPAVVGDVTQLQQVLMNLCVNARDAMPDGGTLTLSARHATIDAREAARDLVRAGTYTAIRVADTGSGIAPGIVDRIFEPFFTSKPTGKGTGLGLSTSQAIVKSHGGFIRVETELGKGTAFTVYLPAQAAPAAHQAVAAAEEIRRGTGELVLVVDDEEPLLRVTSLVLESSGYRVLRAGNGVEALSLFDKHRAAINLVITDMTMPVMDGATLIRSIRSIDADVPIIAVSGLDPRAAQIEGVSQFLPKPLTAQTLLTAVSQAFRGAKVPARTNVSKPYAPVRTDIIGAWRSL